MSYAEIKPQYYRMHQPDSPWHAGSPGWKTAPWPSFYPNPNLVGPPRLAVEGLGAYFKPEYEKPIGGIGEYFATGDAGLGAYFKPEYERPINGLGAFPQRSTYRPRDGVSGLGACPCSARGVGADAAAAATTDASANQLSGALLIGLGALVILVGVVFLGPKKMHANAARKRRKATKRRAKKRGRSYAPKRSARAHSNLYSYWAKIMRRDIAAGYLTPGEVDESLRMQFEKDESDYRSQGITSASQFVKGVRSKL